MLSPNTILRERYRIMQQLGQGGMGAVYQAMDENLSCLVAVKETFAVTDEQRRAFRHEAQLLANLNHPTLPRVTDHFAHGEGQFLVMQFVPGNDLEDVLRLREQPFSVARVIEWADQLLDALEELHSFDPPIIHRDIKPANLKLTPKGKILLLDFGLAKGVAGQMSATKVDSTVKSIYGYTPNYAPLEQMRGRGTDPRSDLYSLAATLWTLLTNKIPPDALSRVAEKEDGNPDPLQPVHKTNPQVPASVSEVLQRAMSLSPIQRHATAAVLRNALRDARQGETERARPPLLQGDSLEQTVLPSTPPPEPTIQFSSPPLVPSWEGEGALPTAASLAGQAGRRRTPWKLAALMVAALFVVAISIASQSGWRPWASEQEAIGAATSVPTAPAGMVYVPGGDFMMGRNDGDEYERPAHKVTVKPFFMDVHHVTYDDYGKFVQAIGYHTPSGLVDRLLDQKKAKATGQPDPWALKPVTGVTWEDANAYAKWAGKRLPTEEEWEFAARGTDGRLYPWGNDWSAGLANAEGASNATVDVGTYKGTSPFGAYDMVGNAWQWTADKLSAYPGGSIPVQVAGANLKVIRGGTYASKASQATTTYRRGWPATGADNYNNTGFRCVEDVQR